MSEDKMSNYSSMTSGQMSDIGQKNTKKSKCSMIVRIICCIFDSDEELDKGQTRKMQKKKTNQYLDQSSRSSSRIEKNNLTIMGSLQDGNNCLTRITQRNFFVDHLQRKAGINQIKPGQGGILFSMFDQGVKLLDEEFSHLLPEKLSRYIAKRIMVTQPLFMVDVSAWSGGPHLFLPEIPLIILLQVQKEILSNARHNAQIYSAKRNLEFIEGNFSCISHLCPDVLYAHPRFIKNNEPFSIYTHIRPDIKNILKNCFLICENLVLILPKLALPTEIASLVSYYLRSLNRKSIKIEIQKILVDGELQFFVVYVGTPAKIENQDELYFMAKMLIQDQQSDDLYQSTYQMLKRVTDTQSLRQILDRTVQAELNAKNKSETILSMFINNCIQERVIHKEVIDDIYKNQQQEIYLPETPQYKAYTPATFDPKDIDYSRQDFTKSSQDRSRRIPHKQSLNTSVNSFYKPNLTLVSFRNGDSPNQQFISQKQFSADIYTKSVNEELSSQLIDIYAQQEQQEDIFQFNSKQNDRSILFK